ncbi:hypothetical protein MWU52_09700 [Jannaschia sp. S6380]|uniref:hypothetical protein n=1 Tax=Jannaschia sp. S6380 TaxID=2926408 RepID=UPI001FF6A41B|nr:hypothetical protein [Jannaschia sp. S6380]MCK0167820.1 hypothetical protein [Jannaschia sp. S6380]
MLVRSLPLLPFAALAGGASADEAAWSFIRGIEVEEVVTQDSYRAIKTYPAEIENGVAQFDITGFAMPLEEGALVRTLMLVSDMVTCPFCGLPDHAAALEVTLADPIKVEEGQRVTLRGALELNRDPETWQAAVLTGARLIPS